jgi:hypothetical protein
VIAEGVGFTRGQKRPPATTGLAADPISRGGSAPDRQRRPAIAISATRVRIDPVSRSGAEMAIHKKILEWQAAHPNITWVGWGIVWVVVLTILLWPRRSG